MRMLAMSSTVLRNGFLIADRQVVALLADQNLADGFAADRSFDRVLHVADVDSVAVGGRAIHIQIHVGLASNLKRSKVGDARDSVSSRPESRWLSPRVFSGRCRKA